MPIPLVLREVELTEHLAGREPGGLEPPYRSSPFPIDQFQLSQRKQAREVSEILLGATGAIIVKLAGSTSVR